MGVATIPSAVASKGRSGYGTIFFTGDKGDGTSSSWTKLGEQVKISLPKMSVKEIDLTNLQSPDATEEKTYGMVSPGDVSLEMTFTKEGYAAALALLRVPKDWQIVFNDKVGGGDPSYIQGTGFLKEISGEVPHDNKITAKVDFAITGKPVFTQAT